MADIQVVDPDAFRREIAECDEVGLLANLILSHGGLHALRFLLRHGPTPEHIAAMTNQIEDNVGIIEQIAAERGISLEFIHQFTSKHTPD